MEEESYIKKYGKRKKCRKDSRKGEGIIVLRMKKNMERMILTLTIYKISYWQRG